MKSAVLRVLMAVFAVSVARCAKLPADPIRLEGNLLTVENQTSRDWEQVEIWLNTYYRITTPAIPAGGRFQAPLDGFVAGFGQRFDFRRAQIRDLRVAAKLSGGEPFELKKQFERNGLGALAGTGGKK